MKKVWLLLLNISLIFIILACSSKKETGNEIIYEANNAIDMFIYDDVAYVNAEDVEWVVALTLEKKEQLGEIKETDVTANFENWDATILAVGSKVFKTNNVEIVLVETDGVLMPYLKYVEG